MATAAALMTSATALAGPVTYTYTGNDFNVIVGSPGPNTSDDLTITATFAGPLPNQSLTIDTPTFWSISDGVDTITSSTAGVSYENFQFAASGGSITAWDIQVNGPSNSLRSDSACTDIGFVAYCDSSNTYAGTNYAVNNISAGVWTSTPEPASVLLFATGLGAIVLRKRFRAV